MPKYAYPEHIYAQHHRNDISKDDSNGIRAQASALTEALSDKRVAHDHQNDSSSSTSEEECDFFSNKELIDQKVQRKIGGRAYIEGGSQFQQRDTDAYDDLINELISNSNDGDCSDKDNDAHNNNSHLDVKKSQIEIDLLKTKYNFYNGTRSSYEGFNKDSKTATVQIIEIPKLPGVFETVEIVAPQPLDTQHTVHASKPKKQKKKRKTRPALLLDDEPIKQIEIIRSQPDEKVKSGKPQQQQQPYQQPKVTAAEIQSPHQTIKSSKASRQRNKQRQATQSVDGKMAISSSLASQQKEAADQQSVLNKNNSQTRDKNSKADESANWQRMGQRAKNSSLSNQDSPFKSSGAATQQSSKTTTTAGGRSDQKSRQTVSSGKYPEKVQGLQSQKGQMRQQNATSQDQRLSDSRLAASNVASSINPFKVQPTTGRQDVQGGRSKKSNSSVTSNSQLRGADLGSKIANSAKESNTESKKPQAKPVFQLKKGDKEEESGSIWARLEPTNVPVQQQNSIAQTPQVPGGGVNSSVLDLQAQQAAQNASKNKKNKNKRKNKAKLNTPQLGAPDFGVGPHNDGSQFFNQDVLQQVSNDIAMTLGQSANQYGEDRSLLAEQLVQILQKSLSEQFGGGAGVPQPMNNFDNYNEEIKMTRASSDMMSSNSVPQSQPKPSQMTSAASQPPSEEDEKFHEMVSVQVKQTVRTFEWKLDSVRKEREAVIDIIESIVKDVFEPKKGERQHGPIVPIGVKQYGSQASFLAVDSSDVDLAVTGLKLGGDIDTQIREMRKLYIHLETKQSEGFIKRCEIIESASVPLIKIEVNLQVVQEINRNKSALQATKEGLVGFVPEPLVQLDESMVILHVDITFDDYNTSILNNRQQQQPQQQMNMMQQQMLPMNTTLPGSLLLGQSNNNSADQSSYFYLRDNPQCSASPSNTMNRFVQQPPNQPYMNPMMQQRFMQQQMMNNGQAMQQQQQQQMLNNSNLLAQSTSLAISSVHKIKELQTKYKDLRNIVLIIKKLLAKHNLHKPYSGGLNSYSIVLMTSTFLEKFGINQYSALSQNLTEFLKFFGNYFDPSTHGCDGTRFFTLQPEQKEKNEHILIRDFQNIANNTSRSAFRIYDIKRVFSTAYESIMVKLQMFKAEQDLSLRMRVNVIEELIQ